MRLAAALLAVSSAFVLAACGGDDEEFTLPPPTTTATGETGATGATGEDGAAGSGDAVEEALTEAGFGIASVDCPDDVPLEEGDTFDCEFTMDSGSGGTMSINVDSADDESATISYLGEAGEDSVEGEGVEVQK
jgi:Domain of unknown function (DUF4333)